MFTKTEEGLYVVDARSGRANPSTHIQYFHFFGRLLGKAIRDSTLVDVPLCPVMYGENEGELVACFRVYPPCPVMYGYRFISPCFFPTFFLTSHASSSCLFIMFLHHLSSSFVRPFPVPSLSLFSVPCLRPFSCVRQGALIGEEPMLEDLAEVDPTVHCSLEWILDHDITEVHSLIGLLDNGNKRNISIF